MKDSTHHRWLHTQLPLWEHEGLLSTENAAALRQRHPVNQEGIGLAQLFMGSLGALLIGSGLIALLAYNWDDFSRPARLMCAFGPLLITQVLSFFALRAGDACPTWVRESAALLQMLTAGACLALVSQIYNMGGDWPDFLFGWLLLGLPLIWSMRSTAVSILYLLGTAVWAVNQAQPSLVWYQSAKLYPLLLLGLLPLWPGWKLEKALSIPMRWIWASSAIFGFFAAAHSAQSWNDGNYWRHFEDTVWLWALTSVVFVLLPMSRGAAEAPLRQKPHLVLGGLFVFGYALMMTFPGSAQEVMRGFSATTRTPWGWLLVVLSVFFGILAARQRRYAVLAVGATLLTPLFALLAGTHAAAWLPWLSTLYLAVLGVGLIILEFTGRQGAPRLGATLLCILILARMLESELSLLVKGTAFILIGVAFLVFNIAVSRLSRQKTVSLS